MNINIPKSGTQQRSSLKQQQNQLVSKPLNHSLNLCQINDKSKSRDRSQNKPHTTTSASSKNISQQHIIQKMDRKNSKSNDSLKQKSSSAKKSQKSKKTTSQSLNSSKFHSQCTQQQQDRKKKSKSKGKQINLSFQSLQNVGDITANFQSLQHSTRQHQNNLSQILQPFNSNQTGQRANSHGNIINIQTPSAQSNNGHTLQNNQNSNYLQLPQNLYMIATGAMASTERSTYSNSGTATTEHSKHHAPITTAFIYPDNVQQSQPPSTNNQKQQIQFNSGRIPHHQQNYSQQQNTYSPVTQKQSSRIQQLDNCITNATVSPMKIIQANPLSFQNTFSPLTQNHGAFLLQKLELFWKERLIKLNQQIQLIRESSFDQDDVIRTMLENQETSDFANQRIIELIKEGIQVDQELQIEQLSKQLVIHQNENLQIAQQRDLIANDFKKLYDDSQGFKKDMEIIINELKKKKNKYKSKSLLVDEIKSEMKQVKDERDNLLEKLKLFQNSNAEKINYTEQKIEELSRMLEDQENQKDQLINTLNQMRDDIQKRELLHNQNIQDVNQQVNEKLQEQKQQLKEKYKAKMQKSQELLQAEIQQKILDIQQQTEAKQQSQSKIDQQTIEYLQNELANLKLQIEDTVSIKEHETILNAQLNEMRVQHEREIEVIKQAFENELRKAEKQVRKSVKQEEDKLKQSVFDFQRNIDKLQKEREQLEIQTKQELSTKDAQISKLQEIINDKDLKYQKDYLLHKEQIKTYEFQIQQLDMSRKEQLESLKIDHTKENLQLTFSLQELQSQIRQLQKDLNDASDQLIMKENQYKEKDSQLQNVQNKFIILEKEYNEYQKRQFDKSLRLNDKNDEVNQLNQQILSLKLKLQDQKNQMKWKLEREQERVKRVKQEIDLLKKLLQQDLEFSQREQQQIISQQMTIFIKKYEKALQKNKQQKDLIQSQDHNKALEQIADLQDKLQKEIKDKDDLAQELKNQKAKFELQVQEFINQQSSLEEHYQEQVKNLQNDLQGELSTKDCITSQNNEYQEEISQLKQENTFLNQKICELDQLLQELDFKLKNCESERDLFKQQLSFEEKSKAEESYNLRQQFQIKQDQLIADFKDQCLTLKSEIEESYQAKLKNKVNHLKTKQQEEITELLQKFEIRDQECNDKIQNQKEQYEQHIIQLQDELNKIKKNYKKLMHKFKHNQKKDQENVTQIEQEVFKSLAKVNQSVSSVRKQNNMSFMSHNKSHSRVIDRTFQNITNQSMVYNNQSKDQVDLSLIQQPNLSLQDLNKQNHYSYHSFQGLQNKLPYQHQTNLQYPQSSRSQYPRKQNFIYNQGLQQNNLNVLADTQSNNHSMLLQELSAYNNNNSNNANMSVNLRRISPISKSLNQTDLSINDASSYIMVSQSQGVWPPSRAQNNTSQFVALQNSNQQQQNIKSQSFQGNNSMMPPLSIQNQNGSHIRQQHNNLLHQVKLNQNSSRNFEMSAEEKSRLREQIDRDKQLLSSHRSSNKKNRLLESSLNRVLNVSNDMVIGGYGDLQASFMDHSAVAYQQENPKDISNIKNQNENVSQPTIGNRGILLDSGVGNNDSFLIARSLSPKEKTGKFGSLNQKQQMKQ